MTPSIKDNYYALFTDHSGIPGIPRQLDIKLFENQIEGDAFGNENRTSYEWSKPAFPDYELNAQFCLYTKNIEEFRFDYYRYANDFIVSDLFLDIIEKYNIPYTKAPVRIFDATHNKELMFQKRYFFVKFSFSEDVVDFGRSVYEEALSDAGVPIVHKGVRYIKKYDNLVLRPEKINREVFLVKDLKLARHLLCGEAFKADILKHKLYGVIIKRLADFVDFSQNQGELGEEAYQRNKNRQQQSAQITKPATKEFPDGKSNVHIRTLNQEEKLEIDQLATAGKILLTSEVKEEMDELNKLASYVDRQKLKPQTDEKSAYQLGSLYGRLIVEQYGWHWRIVTIDMETAYAVLSPDRHFACKVHQYLYALMTPDKTNNLKLLFNMIADLNKQERVEETTFLR